MEADTTQSLINAIPEGIIVLDRKGTIQYISERALELLGSEGQKLYDISLSDVIPTLNAKSPLLNLEYSSGLVDTTCTIYRKGHEKVLSWTGSPLQDQLSREWVFIIRDTAALQTNLLASITHEFRTPLSALKASVELILESLGEISTMELERLLRSIHYSVAGLQTLIDNLLESTSIESGSFYINTREAKLAEVIGEAVQVMSPLLQRREQGLQIEMDWSLPPFPMDPTRISQVIVNLLSNASKYSPPGEGIRIRVIPIAEELLRISVIDHGPGLQPNDQKDLFKKFVRLSDHTGGQFGVGLGLSVVKTIVEAHGGSVGVDENPEGGSIFWFTLPVTNSREVES